MCREWLAALGCDEVSSGVRLFERHIVLSAIVGLNGLESAFGFFGFKVSIECSSSVFGALSQNMAL